MADQGRRGLGGQDALNKVLQWIRWLPVVGRLVDCSYENLRLAFYEVFATILFATTPIWLLPTVTPLFLNVPLSLQQTISTGELFIYSAALAGPLAYIITKRYGSLEFPTEGRSISLTISFPYGGAFVIFCIVMCMISCVAFTVLRLPVEK